MKKSFTQALQAFVSSKEDDLAAKNQLSKAYAQLVDSLTGATGEIRNQTLLSLFSELMSQLDLAPSSEIARVLYMYTFREFLDTYAEEPVIQEAVERYLNTDTISLKLKMALATEYRA